MGPRKSLLLGLVIMIPKHGILQSKGQQYSSQKLHAQWYLIVVAMTQQLKQIYIIYISLYVLSVHFPTHPKPAGLEPQNV
jgi:hypothetical protein